MQNNKENRLTSKDFYGIIGTGSVCRKRIKYKEVIYVKKRLCLLLLCFVLTGLCAIPAVAQDNPLTPAHSTSILYTPAQLRWQKQLDCTHEHTKLFKLTSEDSLLAYCFTCGYIDAPKASDLSAAALANATVITEIDQNNCIHEFGSWSFYDEHECRHMCVKCAYAEYLTHTIVPADCVTDQHCSSCGGAYHTWPLRIGHKLGYYCPDPILTQTHEFRCIRANNDLQLICDYVVRVDSCDFTLEIDPAVDGQHERLGWCVCGNGIYYGSVPCSAPRACILCNMANNVNTWR